jgi:hypothetical protein
MVEEQYMTGSERRKRLREKFKKRKEEKPVIVLDKDLIVLEYNVYRGVSIHSVERMNNGKICKDYNITFAKESADFNPSNLFKMIYKNALLEFELKNVPDVLIFYGKITFVKGNHGEFLIGYQGHQQSGMNLERAIKKSSELVGKVIKKEEREKRRIINRKFTFE